MRMLIVMAMLVGRDASADCTYYGNYNLPANWGGVCVAERSVPEGCPVHFVTPAGGDLSVFPPHVVRGNEEIVVTSSAVVLETVVELVGATDVYSCGCDAVQVAESFDRVELTIVGAREGDGVFFPSEGSAEEASVGIVAPGPCPAPEWPTRFQQHTACDRCPEDPDDNDPDPDPSDPVFGDSDGGGCSTGGGGAGWLLALGVLVGRRRMMGGCASRSRSRC